MSAALTKAAEAIVAQAQKLNLLISRHSEIAKTVGREEGSDKLGGRMYPRRLETEMAHAIALLLPAAGLPNISDAKRHAKYSGLSLAGLDDKPLAPRLPGV